MKSVCKEIPNLSAIGWKGDVRSIDIPDGFKKVVNLWSRNNYNGQKVVAAVDLKCIPVTKSMFLKLNGNRKEE